VSCLDPPSGSFVTDSSNRSNAARYAVLAWFCLAAIVAYVQRASIGVAKPGIAGALNLDDTEMGWVFSGYYWSYAIGQLPAGWLVQRFGTRLVLPLTLALSSLSFAAMGLAETPIAFAAAWTVTGLAVAGIFPCCIHSIVRWFPTDQRAFPSGALGSSMSIGGAISTALTGVLLKEWAGHETPAWRTLFLVYAIPGLVWATAFPWGFREQPTGNEVERGHGETPTARAPGSEHAPWWFDPRTWLICGQQFFRAAGYVFYGTWFPTFLKETRHVSDEESGLLTSLPLLGVAVGGFLGGYLIDAIDRRTRNRRISRQLVAVTCHGLCGLLVLCATLVESPRGAVSLITAGSFVFAIGGACSYTITMDLGGRGAATLFATMNMCGNIGAAVCPIVVGYIATTSGWDRILVFFSGLYFGVSACWAFLDPTPRNHSELQT
jgi:MFS family permease